MMQYERIWRAQYVCILALYPLSNHFQKKTALFEGAKSALKQDIPKYDQKDDSDNICLSKLD